MKVFLWAVNASLGGCLTMLGGIALLAGGSVYGVQFDFSMFVLGLIFLLNAKEMWV